MTFYKSHPLGARSIEFSQNIFNQFGKPVISSPLVQNPYSYVYPYAKKVDEIGDTTLSHLDANFPVVKETNFEALKSHANSIIAFPFKIASDGKQYVFSTYSEEYKKTGGEGLVPTGKAIISTEFRIAGEALRVVSDWVGPKKKQAEEELEKAKSVGQEKGAEAKKTALKKKDELTK